MARAASSSSAVWRSRSLASNSVVRCRARSRATGKSVAMNLHHFFTFRDGKIAYYRGTEDTAQTEQALRS